MKKRMRRAQLVAETVAVLCPFCGEAQPNRREGSEMWTPARPKGAIPSTYHHPKRTGGAAVNSWEIIKEAVRRPETRVGSIGELIDVSKAIKVYMALRLKLKDRKKSDDAFNADELVTKALINKRFLEGIGTK